MEMRNRDKRERRKNFRYARFDIFYAVSDSLIIGKRKSMAGVASAAAAETAAVL